MTTHTLRRPGLVAALLLTITLTATACAKASNQTNTGSSEGSTATRSTTTGMPGMGNGDPMPTGNGTRTSQAGYTFVPATTTLTAGQPTAFAFHITGPNNAPITWFVADQTKLMHFYLIRSDLSGYQHIHPTMANDGTWTANLAALSPGNYRAYASFVTPDAQGKSIAFVLSVPLTAPGTAVTAPVPAVNPTTTADGYTLTLSGQPMVGMSHALTLHVTQNGQPVTTLQPYLETYAHLSAFHAGDLAFAHLHPQGGIATTDNGGPDLTFEADFAESGTWRMYVQFQTGGALHAAAFTINAG